MVIVANVNRELSEKDRIQCNVVISGAGIPRRTKTQRKQIETELTKFLPP